VERLIGKPLIIRTDANTKIGTGHMMRCLALAQTWKDSEGKVIFSTRCGNETLLNKLRLEQFELHVLPECCGDQLDWESTQRLLGNYPDAWVVLDGYHFAETYQKRLKEFKHPLLVTDSTAHLQHYYADLILNHSFCAHNFRYFHETYTRFMLGPAYFMMRREFLPWRNWQREIPTQARRILVTLGGSDPMRQTAKVVAALKKIKREIEVTIVLGEANSARWEIEALITGGEQDTRFRMIENSDNMASLMAAADLAITAGGITSREMCFMGLPMLIIVVANNQESNAAMMHDLGVAENLGWYKNVSEELLVQSITSLLTSPQQRLKLSSKGREMIDGLGTERVISQMLLLQNKLTASETGKSGLLK
jgi:UDP-2,4-diacetamido-2,4,6-trideoxy-beta-L-altropyranose hydrolase